VSDGLLEDLRLVVAGDRRLTATVRELDLRDPAGAVLPPHPAGSHVTLTTPGGHRRSYSVTNPPSERDRYVVAVQREAAGRGGSASLVDDLRVGDAVSVAAPRATVELVDAERYLFVAGGIGITPLRAMLHEVLARGHRDATLLYLTRSPETTAYREELAALVAQDDLAHVVVLHHSASAGRVDLWPWLEHPDDGLHLYACASAGLLAEVRALTAHWRPSRVHLEDFAGVAPLRAGGSPFTAVWAPTGARVEVPAATTLLDALAAAGVDVPRSCASGTCGTCRLVLLAGTVEHRDLVLPPGEHSTALMPCVSRAQSPEITVGPA